MRMLFVPSDMDTEIAILKRKWVQKNGVACNDVELYTTETLTPIF